MTPKPVASLVFGLCLALMALPAPLAAQSTAPEAQNFPAERMRIASDRNGLIDLESGVVTPHLAWDAGLWLGYARSPLVLTRLSDNRRLGSLVANRIGGSLVASLGLFEYVEAGLELPLILYQNRASDAPNALIPGTSLAGLSSTNVGDLRVQAKVRLLRQEAHGISLAIMPAVGLPSSRGHAYSGTSGVQFVPELLLSRSFGRLHAGANLGANLRRRSVSLNQTIDSELTAHLGLGYRFDGVQASPARGLPLELDASVSAAVAARNAFAKRNQDHLEARLMASYDLTRRLRLFVGGGMGLARGWGTPDARGFIGARFGGRPEAVPRDRDRDGIVDAQDRCPDQPETRNGYQDEDGCPDRVPDVDSDGDGLVDRLDACPQQAEDRDGFEDADGCPDPDNDGDGVLDAVDRCPLQPGPADNGGCPELDTDGDGIPDRRDPCPNAPGPAEHQGCPNEPQVILSSEKIELLENINFKLGSADIDPVSLSLLDSVAAVIKSHPQIARVRVEGHTDNRGRAAFNLTLSQRRCDAVVRYLIKQGIDPSRLLAQGFGQTVPIGDNTTAEGRQKNRRVMFNIDASAPAPDTAHPEVAPK